MKTTRTTLFLLATVCLLLVFSAKQDREYSLKAGFLYKFLLFAQWPEAAFSDPEAPIIIGIHGENPFGDLFDMVAGQSVNGRKLLIKHLEQTAAGPLLEQCHLLFITASMAGREEAVLAALHRRPVLTVSELTGFAEKGGMIHFRMNDDKVSFVINKTAADRVGIKLRAKLLRVAARVLED